MEIEDESVSTTLALSINESKTVKKLKEDLIINNNNIIFNKNILYNKDEILIPKKTLTPRPYQEKIFAKARNQNSIIFLETGRGKTFISIMLMADLLDIKLSSFLKPNPPKNKKIIFLVCDTALIEQ